MEPTLGTLLAASILQLVAIVPGILWFVFIARGLERSRQLHYLAVGWGIQGLMYLLQVPMSFGARQLEEKDLDAYNSAVLVVDSTLSLLSSTTLLMAWYLMRDLRFGVEDKVGDTIPTMSKDFLFQLVTALAAVLSAFITTVGLIVQYKFLEGFYVGVDIIAAVAAGVLIGWELWKMPFLETPENAPLFSERAFNRAKFFGSAVFIVWGVSQIGHILSLSDTPHSSGFFVYPTGIFYYYLAVLKILCAASAGILCMHALPEKARFRHQKKRHGNQDRTEV